MSQLTKDIAKWLKVDEETATKVKNEMAIYWGANFSEDDATTLKDIAKMAYEEMKKVEASQFPNTEGQRP